MLLFLLTFQPLIQPQILFDIVDVDLVCELSIGYII